MILARPRRSRGAGLSRSGVLAAAAVVAVAVTATLLVSRAPRPNVLVLVMDTARADRCSFLGYERPTTPRLDELARDATVFRDAWSPSNWTGSAHASLFTGLRTEHHGFQEGTRDYLGTAPDTLAGRLAAAGYATACFSNNTIVAPEFGLVRGFEKYVPMFAQQVRPLPWARQTHEQAADWAAAQEKAGRPFFLFINDVEPHLPYDPPEDVSARFLRGSPPAADVAAGRRYEYPRSMAYNLGVEELSEPRRGILSDLYDGEMAGLDAEIGTLLDRLRESGLLDSTLVVIVSDHGENLGEHHLFEHGLGLHRTLCRVPLLVRGPGGFRGGRVVEDVVRLEDVLPTVLEACGVGLPANIDGISLAHDLPGRVARAVQPLQVRWRDRVVEQFGAAGTAKLFRACESAYDGRFHLIRWSDGAEELFDVRADPGETRNVAAGEPAALARLRGLLPPPAAPPPK